MNYVGATITEHYQLIGEEIGTKRGEKIGEKRGKKRGEKIGKEIGKVEGQIALLHQMKNTALIDDSHFQAMLGPLELRLRELEAQDRQRQVHDED